MHLSMNKQDKIPKFEDGAIIYGKQLIMVGNNDPEIIAPVLYNLWKDKMKTMKLNKSINLSGLKFMLDNEPIS